MKILKTHTVIAKRHANQNWLWKKLHQAKMLVCKHNIEPMQQSEYSYYSNIKYGECIHCEDIAKFKPSKRIRK